MKIKEIQYLRLKNLGNYENETVGVTAQLDEDDDPSKVLSDLKKFVCIRLDLELPEEEKKNGRFNNLEVI